MPSGGDDERIRKRLREPLRSRNRDFAVKRLDAVQSRYDHAAMMRDRNMTQLRRPLGNIAVIFCAGLLAACQTVAAATTPAVLVNANNMTMTAVRAVLANAVNRATIELGPDDPTRSPVISVLPPRPGALETRSTATPIVFDLVMSDGACFAVRRASGEQFELKNVACRPFRR